MLRFVSQLVRLVNVNRVSQFRRDGVDLIKKRRWPFNILLIVPGNWVFSFRQVPVRVLPTKQWLSWELMVAETMERAIPQTTERSLTMPRWGGANLPTHWTTGDISIDKRLSHAGMALRSLTQFHQHIITLEPDDTVLLSHGDATVRNVMFDATTNSVTWFDFDLRHDLTVSATARHADDLRAFLFSAAHYFSMEDLPDLVRVARDNYSDSKVWGELSKQVSSPWFRFDLFHLAHTLPPKHKANQQRSPDSFSRKQEALIQIIGNNVS